ncbi:MAG: Ppx/GppA family phosphatase [Actinobacteria bacterium]|nr:MAG: Ppx/GppA family phosphatase [Actinomycetota bacterium]
MPSCPLCAQRCRWPEPCGPAGRLVDRAARLRGSMRRRRGDESGLAEPSMKVGVVDIGTNSMRLLITSGEEEVGRWVEVTGLGKGVDASGRLSGEAMERTIEVFDTFGRLMEREGVTRRTAIATSASRDASNREDFFDRAESALGVRPTLITGETEAGYAFAGATRGREDLAGVVVADIGGGSTELVDRERSISVDVGSVRLTDRILTDRPPSPEQLRAAIDHVRGVLHDQADFDARSLVGIAGTWTSLAAIAQELPEYDRDAVHGYVMTRSEVAAVLDRLSTLTIEETAALSSLDPKRAPVILAGAVIAQEVVVALDVDAVEISEMDTLDGVAAEMLDLR